MAAVKRMASLLVALKRARGNTHMSAHVHVKEDDGSLVGPRVNGF
jgi:hypothetical protein